MEGPFPSATSQLIMMKELYELPYFLNHFDALSHFFTNAKFILEQRHEEYR